MMYRAPFLSTSRSLAIDLDPRRREVIFSRPVSSRSYLAAKCASGVVFTMGVAALLMVVSAAQPVFGGAPGIHDLRPFLRILAVAVLPMVLFACASATLLTVASRRLIVAFPVFLSLFFMVALLRLPRGMLRGSRFEDFFDFSFRIYPEMTSLPVGALDLPAASFAGILTPLDPVLALRAVTFAVLAIGLATAAVPLLEKRRRA